MTNFHEIRLENALAFYNGKVVNIENTGDIPVYGSNGIIGFTDKSLFEDGIVIGRVGAYCGATIYEKGKFWGSDNTIIVEAKTGFDNQYLSYLLQVIDLNWFAGGSVQPLITHGWIKPIKAKIPDYFHQQKIAAILSAYDDLIENNLQRIKLLEEMAQITYEEWFVRMKFPGHEHAPINPEIGLPEGWGKRKIHEIGQVITGKTPSTSNANYFGGDILFIKTPDMSDHPYVITTEQYLSEDGAKSQYKKYLPKNSLMISCIGSAGVYALTAMPSQTNQQINAIIFSDELYVHYMYCYSKHIKPLLQALGSNGATMTNVNKSKFEAIEVVVPSVILLRDFENIASRNFDIILSLQNQNQLLKEARDILLPRLMTGMIDVEQIELPETLLARIEMEASA